MWMITTLVHTPGSTITSAYATFKPLGRALQMLKEYETYYNKIVSDQMEFEVIGIQHVVDDTIIPNDLEALGVSVIEDLMVYGADEE